MFFSRGHRRKGSKQILSRSEKKKNPPGGGTGRVIMIGAGDRGGSGGADLGVEKVGDREVLHALVARTTEKVQ